MNILRELHASGRTIVLITHDPSVAQNASRQIHVLDGRIVQ
jgi:ABC-type lipoprotein export system ATPase subunit